MGRHRANREQEEQAPLLMALPSKGRLSDAFADFAARADLRVQRSSRGYTGSLGFDDGIAVRFMPAAQIADELALGSIHLGLTGRDLIHDRLAPVAVRQGAGSTESDSAVTELLALGFGSARVVVAVPDFWLDVTSMGDLRDVTLKNAPRPGKPLRVATRYLNLTRAFFAKHRIDAYHLFESAGATEAAPAAGLAEAIVDIATTGATLKANHLVPLTDGTILESEACLFSASRSGLTERQRLSLARLLDRIKAQALGSESWEVRFRLGRGHDRQKLMQTLREHHAEAFALTDGAAVFFDGSAATLHCKRRDLHPIVASLRAQGAERIAVSALTMLVGRGA